MLKEGMLYRVVTRSAYSMYWHPSPHIIFYLTMFPLRPKLKVAGSNPVSRSEIIPKSQWIRGSSQQNGKIYLIYHFIAILIAKVISRLN